MLVDLSIEIVVGFISNMELSKDKILSQIKQVAII